MAIKIYSNKIVDRYRSQYKEKFELKDLAIALAIPEEQLYFIDMGILILVFDKESTILNSAASLFFRTPVMGDVLLLSGRELNIDVFGDILTEENCKYDIDFFENNVLLGIKDTLKVFQLVSANEGDFDINNNIAKNIFYAKPFDLTKMNKEELQFTKKLLLSTVNILEMFNKYESDTKLSDLILMEEQDFIVKFPEDPIEIEAIINDMIKYFVKKEKFKKCQILKNAISYAKENKKLV